MWHGPRITSGCKSASTWFRNLSAWLLPSRPEPRWSKLGYLAEAAVIEAVADALIRLEAKVPADVVMHLYPRFPAQTIILLSRAPDNSGPLMQIFRETKSRDLWLAAGNLLAVHPPPGFVRTLLGGAVTNFSFRVVWTRPEDEAAEGGGCAGDYMMTHDEHFRDWPKARMYRINHGEQRPQCICVRNSSNWF